MYLFFFEAYNVLTHCEVGSNVFIPFEKLLHAKLHLIYP